MLEKITSPYAAPTHVGSMLLMIMQKVASGTHAESKISDDAVRMFQDQTGCMILQSSQDVLF